MPESPDIREQLFNSGETGPATSIQLPAEAITRLLAIMADLDPGILLPGNPLFPPAADPADFFAGIRTVIDRHPLFRHSEVRSSGGGLHLLLWFDAPVEFHTAEDRSRWGAVARAVTATLPSDPDQPGITALTRAVDSINSKNGRKVIILRAGTPVTAGSVTDFVSRLAASPFRIVAETLLGTTSAVPCPICRGPKRRLDALDRVGKCYGGCGKVSLGQLLNLVMAPRPGPASPVAVAGAASVSSGPSAGGAAAVLDGI